MVTDPKNRPYNLRGSVPRKGHKRKLGDSCLGLSAVDGPNNNFTLDIRTRVDILRTCLSWKESQRVAARHAAHALAELEKHGERVETIVHEGAVDALVPQLHAPIVDEGEGPVACEHEVEKDTAFALGLLAVKLILMLITTSCSFLVNDWRHHQNLCHEQDKSARTSGLQGIDILHVAHENTHIKNCVRMEGGIPPLVKLLESTDGKIYIFKNEANQNQAFIDCKCGVELMRLFVWSIDRGGECSSYFNFMLQSEDAGIHYEAVFGVIGNLVHSSVNIKKEVLAAGALQPVIGLLSSRCQESQREAALLLGQFATTDPECKVNVIQSPDPQLCEMAAFALGHLAQSSQNSHNQAGIVHDGGLRPLLELLDSKNGSLQHNAAFALYGLADNEDNVSDIVREGGVQRLFNGEPVVQASKDCVQKTLKRLEEKIHGWMSNCVLKHLLYLMRSADKIVQRRHIIFIENGKSSVLLEMLTSFINLKLQHDGAHALCTLAKKATAVSPIEVVPLPPTPQVYLGEQYVNSSTLSDVTFLVEGRQFFAHRIALLASSDAFCAMFDSGYMEMEAKDIEIPNISWKVFELMMRVQLFFFSSLLVRNHDNYKQR
ncbi:hypothetical protein CY35_01G012100 [Sphagnum magellanicum]|nr:hypothetical protein CY35_01G012100 [Sphagnum magellanicum]